jgi:hypothetical protein
MRTGWASTAACVLVLALVPSLAGCGNQPSADRSSSPGSQASSGATPGASAPAGPGGASSSPAAGRPSVTAAPGSTEPWGPRTVPSSVKESAPPRLSTALTAPDMLVYSQKTIGKDLLAQLAKVGHVQHVEPISMGSFYADEQEITYAAVDPDSFRRYTTPGTAQTQGVWDRVADGEMAVEPSVAKELGAQDGWFKLGNGADAQQVHIGAYAQILDPAYARHIDAVVNSSWAEKLGMRVDNAAIVSTGSYSPQKVRPLLQKVLGTQASIQILGPDLDINAVQTAFLTGGSVAAAVGSFSYRALPNGSVVPDPAWVARNIRTEVMPIIGPVTGHRVMLPQLRAALLEVVQRGLASKIYHFDGCYVPRFIARDPSKGLSFHTYGTAIDLNASDNQRGTVGKMDRDVVAIFKKWGFAWGGDWNYTDPMHFELARLVSVR